MLKLTKTVPEHKKIVVFLWLHRNFIPMSQEYRKARSRMKSKMDACFWCGHKFKDGELMALAAIKGKTNRVLCQDCAAEAEA